MWCRVFNSSIFNLTSLHISSKFISWPIWKIKQSRDSRRMIIFVLFINLLIITLIFAFEFINSMILIAFSMIIFVLRNSQTYHCSSLFYVIDRDLIELTWKLITSSLKKIFEKIFCAKEAKTMTSIKKKIIWTFFNLIRNSFLFISFLQISMMRDLLRTLLRASKKTTFCTFLIFLIFLIILIFSLSKAKHERCSTFFESFSFFWKISFITRFRTSFFSFIVAFFHFSDLKIFEMSSFSSFFTFLFKIRLIISWCLTSFLKTLNSDRVAIKMTSTFA